MATRRDSLLPLLGPFGTILSPSLTIPCRKGSSITRGEAALNLLSCLRTLARGKTLDEDLLVVKTGKSSEQKAQLTFKEFKRFTGSERTCITCVAVMCQSCVGHVLVMCWSCVGHVTVECCSCDPCYSIFSTHHPMSRVCNVTLPCSLRLFGDESSYPSLLIPPSVQL